MEDVALKRASVICPRCAKAAANAWAYLSAEKYEQAADFERLRRERLSVLDRVAAHFPKRDWSAEPQGFGLLRSAGGRIVRRRHCAISDALPLGPAAGAAGQG